MEILFLFALGYALSWCQDNKEKAKEIISVIKRDAK